ncbi:hypothetical protein K491DRAFT_784017 [Lophiostoma macrostomum CBS 122681]|uniref:Uncharacterized protein n=1 Tax=Lophiostoma macrostomum CBS 122681 TaxID=1314788 RepID=A0A6A6SLN8_9PLEO|nr:hypothetical protein K491DRAFT_784017 [Lophiostoma macrostomum CBS 122681]
MTISDQEVGEFAEMLASSGATPHLFHPVSLFPQNLRRPSTFNSTAISPEKTRLVFIQFKGCWYTQAVNRGAPMIRDLDPKSPKLFNRDPRCHILVLCEFNFDTLRSPSSNRQPGNMVSPHSVMRNAPAEELERSGPPKALAAPPKRALTVMAMLRPVPAKRTTNL